MRKRFLQGAPPPCAARQSTPIKGLSRWADAFWEGDVHAVKSRFGFRTCCWALPHLEPIESEPRLRLSGECAARLRSNRAPCPHLPPASLCVGTGVVRIPCSQELLHGVPRAVTRDPNPKPLNPKLKPVHHAPAIFLLHAVRGQQHLIRRGKPPLGRHDAYWAQSGARGEHGGATHYPRCPYIFRAASMQSMQGSSGTQRERAGFKAGCGVVGAGYKGEESQAGGTEEECLPRECQQGASSSLASLSVIPGTDNRVAISGRILRIHSLCPPFPHPHSPTPLFPHWETMDFPH